jgi:thioredoxin reductase
MNKSTVAIIGAGPYGLSLAAHLARRKVEHRIFGHPMLFWSQIADAGGERYLKSFCFGTNISSPTPGSTFADFSVPRGLETFEPCSIRDFANYGLWFQKKNVGWVEPVEVKHLSRKAQRFEMLLSSGERVVATHVVVATGLSNFAFVPQVLRSLPASLLTHTSNIKAFKQFKGRSVAIIGAGQSALEAAALLHEANASPFLLVRKTRVLWNTRSSRNRDLLQRLRVPISGLGGGRKAWLLTHFPAVTHHMPATVKARFLKDYLPAEGAWWLRERVENAVPLHFATSVMGAREIDGRVVLRLQSSNGKKEQTMIVDHVIAGSGYEINVQRLAFFDAELRGVFDSQQHFLKLNSTFEASIPGLYFIGPLSQFSFGPLFRFVVGAEYTARKVSAHLASNSYTSRYRS